jgi:hypothetical protein
MPSTFSPYTLETRYGVSLRTVFIPRQHIVNKTTKENILFEEAVNDWSRRDKFYDLSTERIYAFPTSRFLRAWNDKVC